jgi:hypothetical protein
MAEFEATMRAIGWGAVTLFALLFLGRAWWVYRNWQSRIRVTSAPPSIKILQGFRGVALVFLAAGLVLWLLIFQRGTFFMPAALQATLVILLLFYFVFEIGMLARPHRVVKWMYAAGTAVSLAAGAIGLLLTASAMRGFAHPPPSEGSTLTRLPFDGEWVAVGAGASGVTNHHDRIASQKYAADLAALCEDGRPFRGAGVALKESCTFGRPIFAPVDGVVSHAEDGHEDGASRDVLPGNHVIIHFGKNRYVALAHLKQGTVDVAAGDIVRAGQEIGLAGNSGNSDFAHLHIHVQDSPTYDIATSRGLPYRFATMERKRFLWWSEVKNGFLLSNDRVRPATS